MTGLGDNNNDDDERFRNLMMFRIYATDEEMGEMGGCLMVIIIIALIVFGIWCLFN